jgi:hypothetical protein
MQMRRGVGLGQDEKVGRRARAEQRVKICQTRPGIQPVDAQRTEHRSARRPAEVADCRGTCLLLVRRRDGVFEIRHEHVRADLRRLAEPVGPAGRCEEPAPERPPDSVNLAACVVRAAFVHESTSVHGCNLLVRSPPVQYMLASFLICFGDTHDGATTHPLLPRRCR